VRIKKTSPTSSLKGLTALRKRISTVAMDSARAFGYDQIFSYGPDVRVYLCHEDSSELLLFISADLTDTQIKILVRRRIKAKQRSKKRVEQQQLKKKAEPSGLHLVES